MRRSVFPSRTAVCPPSSVAPSKQVTDESSDQRTPLEANEWFALFRFLCNNAQHAVFAPSFAGPGRLVLSHRHSAHRRGATRNLWLHKRGALRSLCLERGAARSSQCDVTEDPFTLAFSRNLTTFRRGSTTTTFSQNSSARCTRNVDEGVSSVLERDLLCKSSHSDDQVYSEPQCSIRSSQPCHQQSRKKTKNFSANKYK